MDIHMRVRSLRHRRLSILKPGRLLQRSIGAELQHVTAMRRSATSCGAPTQSVIPGYTVSSQAVPKRHGAQACPMVSRSGAPVLGDFKLVRTVQKRCVVPPIPGRAPSAISAHNTRARTALSRAHALRVHAHTHRAYTRAHARTRTARTRTHEHMETPQTNARAHTCAHTPANVHARIRARASACACAAAVTAWCSS
jgi:hypothetical protein